VSCGEHQGALEVDSGAQQLQMAGVALEPDVTGSAEAVYIETWLGFIGISEIRTVVVEKTLFGPDIDRAARDSARAQAVAEVKQLSRADSGGRAPGAEEKSGSRPAWKEFLRV
jgi:hypothetical protein